MTIVLIDPWKLLDGSYIECNTLRHKSGLGTLPKFEIEIDTYLGRNSSREGYIGQCSQ